MKKYLQPILSQLNKLSRAARTAIISAVSLVLVVALAVLLAPMAVAIYRHTEARVAEVLRQQDLPGRSGLIYVESPEVYTRQRLVNDRYLQDAWLRERLDDVDKPNAGWIETVELERRIAQVRLMAEFAEGSSGSDGDAADPTYAAELPEGLASYLSAVPFEARFQLQSQARDKIRQQILENALDDRHDLSGNTVFGLKFDTSILPGSASHLSPTVLIEMDANPLDRLLGRHTAEGERREPAEPEEFVRYFTRVALSDRWESTDSLQFDTLVDFDRHFDDWRYNVERRLEKYREDAEARRGSLTTIETKRLLNAGLCDGQVLAAEDDLINLFETPVRSIDDSLEYVTRLSGIDIQLGSKFRRQIIENARAWCGKPERPAVLAQGTDSFVPASGSREIAEWTVGDFLQHGDITFQHFQMPGSWGQFFDARPEYRIDVSGGEARFELDLSLADRDLPVFLMQSGVPSGSKLSPVRCEKCQDAGFSVWVGSVDRSRLDRLQSILTSSTLQQLREVVAGPLDAKSQCHAQPSGDDEGFMFEDQVYADGTLASDAFRSRDFLVDCKPGRAIQIRIGAFQFFRKMTEVESYSYAAFPRGDVRGVVIEAGSDQGLEAEVGAAGGRVGITLGRELQNRSVVTRPSLINFASGQSRYSVDEGDSPELFDFGWTIVKEGPKAPMMASQLVLLSVPAYLDEIRLILWKGFLDFDRAPMDRAAFNELPLKDRIKLLMPSLERRTITLKVPPDFAALDSIVIGRNEVFGPKINDLKLKTKTDCYREAPDGSLTLAIPGERLWRSTVVTLDGRKADRIEVLPDMRGILATFLPSSPGVSCPAGDTQQNCRPQQPLPIFQPFDEKADRDLVVWTSESNDSVTIRTCHKVGGAETDIVADASAESLAAGSVESAVASDDETSPVQ